MKLEPQMHPVKAALNVLFFVALVCAGFAAAVLLGWITGAVVIVCCCAQIRKFALDAINGAPQRAGDDPSGCCQGDEPRKEPN